MGSPHSLCHQQAQLVAQSSHTRFTRRAVRATGTSRQGRKPADLLRRRYPHKPQPPQTPSPAAPQPRDTPCRKSSYSHSPAPPFPCSFPPGSSPQPAGAPADRPSAGAACSAEGGENLLSALGWQPVKGKGTRDCSDPEAPALCCRALPCS